MFWINHKNQKKIFLNITRTLSISRQCSIYNSCICVLYIQYILYAYVYNIKNKWFYENNIFPIIFPREYTFQKIY